MADSQNKKPEPKHEKQVPNKVVQLPTGRCIADGCSERALRADFCKEHYQWFKEGLINREGHKPRDFEKKYHAYLRRKAA